MSKKNEIIYRFSLKLRWPSICRNRSVETLKERPDLIEQMNRYRQKIDNVLKLICRKSFQIDGAHSMTGVRLWFESGQDTYDFIIRQPEFDWEIISEVSMINSLTSQLQTFNILYTPSGVIVD
jgi:hypothetical protein